MNKNSSRARLVAGALFLAAAAFTPGGAQTPETLAPHRARLLGVYNAQTGDVIVGAEVIDVLSKTTALTTATGTVTLSFLPDGGSMVRVQKVGFEPMTTVIPITPADTLPFMVLLKPLAASLPTLVTKDSTTVYAAPALRQFEERRLAGRGRFITAAELRKKDNRKMPDVIRSLGVQVQCSKVFPYPCYAVSNRVGGKSALRDKVCPLDIYYDGTPIRIQEDRDLERIKVNEIGAVEAYSGPAAIPAQFNATGSSCGALLFWSRER